MPNKKITQLPPSATPLTGAELLPVVQSSATVQTSVNSLGPGIGYTPAGAGAVATTVQTKLRESVSVKDFGAVGNGTTDDTAAITAAIAAAGVGGNILVPAGMNCLVSSEVTFSVAGQQLSARGAKFTKAGIIDQKIKRNFLTDDPCSQTLTLRGLGKICLEAIDSQIGMQNLQCIGKRGKAFFAAPHKDQARGDRGKLTRKLGSKSRRSSSNKSRAVFDRESLFFHFVG
jgi:hypothetical protein